MTTLPNQRLQRAWDVLQGLSTGDAFGERFFQHADVLGSLIMQRALPAAPWPYTDDTEMALSIVAILCRHEAIDQDALAQSFAQHYDAMRGYGPAMHRLLHKIAAGQTWQTAAPQQFKGQGSYGNGAAMRVAPLGAYFADDLDQVITQALRSAEVTHAHHEGIVGAIAVAIATAWAWRIGQGQAPSDANLVELVLPYLPESEVASRLGRALQIGLDAPVITAAAIMGNGIGISAQDTVPFCIWSAARSLNNYEEALWSTASALGDVDTTCAIVGGIVSAALGPSAIPADWLECRETLPGWPLEAAAR